MAETLQTLQEKVAALVDQSTTPPTVGGSEWLVRTSFINRALKEWADSYDWESLRVISWLNTSGVSGASVLLPTDFKKMAGSPISYDTGVSEGEAWFEIRPEERDMYATTDKFYYTQGDDANGYTMYWSPTTLISGASVQINYYKNQTTLSSSSDETECPATEFVIDRTIAYIFEARSDARFQEMEAKARDKLLLMIDNENSKSSAVNNTVKTPEQRYYGFRIGRD